MAIRAPDGANKSFAHSSTPFIAGEKLIGPSQKQIQITPSDSVYSEIQRQLRALDRRHYKSNRNLGGPYMA